MRHRTIRAYEATGPPDGRLRGNHECVQVNGGNAVQLDDFADGESPSDARIVVRHELQLRATHGR
ncbi:hypothetical protein [Streptomyces tailanensis]|uniref:hypothetical protein n=1 Tax=Streptomyces tailanensis TaxID=2569858 RepID=UPI00122DC870|nr:hypothetical protein [Streptomyces tailanensis]